MEQLFGKIFSVILVLLLLMNLLYYGMGKVDLFFFWLNLGILGLISYFMYGDKSRLKRILKIK